MIPAEPAINMQYLCRLFQPHGPFISSFPLLSGEPTSWSYWYVHYCSEVEGIKMFEQRKNWKIRHNSTWLQCFPQLSTKPSNTCSSKQHLSTLLLWNQDAQTQNPPREPAEGHSVTAWTQQEDVIEAKERFIMEFNVLLQLKITFLTGKKLSSFKVRGIPHGQSKLSGDCCLNSQA